MLHRLRAISVIEVATLLAIGFAVTFFVFDFYLMSTFLGLISIVCLINVTIFEGLKSSFEIHFALVLIDIGFVAVSMAKLIES